MSLPGLFCPAPLPSAPVRQHDLPRNQYQIGTKRHTTVHTASAKGLEENLNFEFQL